MASTEFGGLEAAPGDQRTRVWDLPTRVFHWALAGAVVGLVVTGSAGIMEWHFRLGYAVLALLLFRLVWGFVGGRWSRFASFVYSPGSVWNDLRGQAPPAHRIGHAPLGALSVFALLAILLVQVATGLVADDEISATGPLSRFVPESAVSLATAWHKAQGKWIVIGLTSLHVLAVLFHVLFKRQALVRAMLTGRKRTPGGAAPSRDDGLTRLGAAALFMLCLGLAWWISTLRP